MKEKYKKLNDMFVNLSTKNMLLILIFSVCIARALIKCKLYSINVDFYWMINLGNYIKENHAFPDTNIWVIHENFNNMYQSWLASIAVYGWYELFQENMLSTVFLGYIYIIIHTIAAYKYCKLFTENKLLALATSSICTLVVGTMLNVRPSLITSAVFYIELTLLTKFYIKKTGKGFKKLALSLAIISTFISNWQSAAWPFVIILELPFIAQTLIYLLGIIKTDADKKLYRLQLKQQLISIPIIILAGLINPYGYKAEIYLWLSRSTSKWSMSLKESSLEQGTVTLFSFEWFLILAFIIILILCIRKKRLQPYELFLTLGTLFVAALQRRQSYMLMYGMSSVIISFTLLYKDKLSTLWTDSKSNIRVKYLSIVIITVAICCFFIAENYNYIEGDFRSLADYIDSDVEANNLDKSDLKILTECLPSAYMQYRGYKTYMDTRYEMVSSTISGQTPRTLPDGSELDVLDEYFTLGYYLYNSDLNNLYEYYDSSYLIESSQNFNLWLQCNPEYEALYEDFFTYYDFDYAVVSNSCFKYYIDNHPSDWECIELDDNEQSEYALYKRIRN
jgi:hypothetical protein